jgi:hypothetical protein
MVLLGSCGCLSWGCVQPRRWHTSHPPRGQRSQPTAACSLKGHGITTSDIDVSRQTRILVVMSSCFAAGRTGTRRYSSAMRHMLEAKTMSLHCELHYVQSCKLCHLHAPSPQHPQYMSGCWLPHCVNTYVLQCSCGCNQLVVGFQTKQS